MGKQIINFGIQSYKSDSLPVSAQRLLNAYAEIHPADAKVKVSIHGMPGCETWITVGTGPIRGFHKMGDILYVVSRDEFYSVASDGTATLRGNGVTGLAPVSIAGNGTQVMVANGSLGFIYNSSTLAFAQISDGDFEAGYTTTFIDGYFVVDWAGTNKFKVCDLLDGTSWSALMFASAESDHDRVQSVYNQQGVLRLLGERTTENWDSTGAGTPPFQRFSGATTARGILSALAFAAEDNSLFMLGDDRIFYRVNGTQPIRISTHAIEKHWQSLTTVSDAFCFVVIWGGHKWIYVTFPTEGETWGYDVATRLWHERSSFDASGLAVRWRANCCINAFGKILIGDANSGKIGSLSASVYDEFGDAILLEAVSAPIYGNGSKIGMSSLILGIETGVGLTAGQGSDPQIVLDWSDDQGANFGNELWRSMGALGQRNTEVRWNQLGSFYERTLRLRISDPVKRSIHLAVAELT